MLNIAKEERETDARPEIQNPLTDINQYDYILLGYPIWHSHIPNIIITQLEKLNLSGKTIYPFNTHGGSGVGSSISDIKTYASGANVKDGKPISGNQIQSEEDEVIDWLDDNFDLDSDEGISPITPKNNSNTKIKFKYYLLISLFILF